MMSEHTQLCKVYEANIAHAAERKSCLRRAAPDLLSACEAIVADCEEADACGEVCCLSGELRTQLETAIAKAKGKP